LFNFNIIDSELFSILQKFCALLLNSP